MRRSRLAKLAFATLLLPGAVWADSSAVDQLRGRAAALGVEPAAGPVASPAPAAADEAALLAQAHALFAAALPPTLKEYVGKHRHEALARLIQKVQSLPGRSAVFLEAPTTSGKSSLAEKLSASLGARVKTLTVDLYFKAESEIPKGPDGRPNFDCPDALNLDRAARDIRTLLAGGRVELPLREDEAPEAARYHSGHYLEVGPDEVLFVDSIYASHEKLLAAAEGHEAVDVFLERPAVLRLARRLRRDRRNGISADSNLSRWPVILDDERRFIQPLKSRADFVLNLVKPKQIDGLADLYTADLAEEWRIGGVDPSMTGRFLQGIRESLAADAATAR